MAAPTAHTYATQLLLCLCAELQANADSDPLLPKPVRCCLRGGVNVPLDISPEGIDRCCEGEAYVKFTGQFPSSTFPEPDGGPLSPSCVIRGFALGFEMGVFRCLPEDPNCEDSSLALYRQAADAEAAFRAACCWGKSLQRATPGTLWWAAGWEPFGPEGQCLGGTMPLFASMRGGCC